MEEETTQRKEDEFLRVAVDDANNEQQRSVDMSWDRTGTFNKRSFSNVSAAENPMANIKSCTSGDPLSLEKSKPYILATPFGKKTLGTLAVLTTSPMNTYFDAKTTYSLITDSGESSSLSSTNIGSAKIEQGSGKISEIDVSRKVELCLRESSNDEISIIKRIVNNNRRISNTKPLDNMDCASVLRGIVHSPPHGASINKVNSSHALEAIYENNKNNNNNIDKPCEPITFPSADWKMAMTGNERLCSQVFQKKIEKSSFHSSDTADSGAQRLCTGISTTSIGTAPINTIKSANLSRQDSSTQHTEAFVCVQSFNQTQPTVNLTVSKPKLPTALQCGTSYTTFVPEGIDSPTEVYRRRVSPAYKSQTERDISHSAAFWIQGNCADHWSAQSVSRTEKIVSLLNLPPCGRDCNETSTSSSCAETQSMVTMNQSNSFPQHSVRRHYEETRGESKASPGQPCSSGYNKDTISQVTFTDLHHLARQGPSYAANHPKSAIKSLTSTVQLSSAHSDSQLVMTHGMSFNSKDRATSSVPAGRMMEASPTSIKKPHSKNVKQKSQKAHLLTNVDDEDDNDFIPVGMLQLSALKIPEGSSTNVDTFSTENRMGSQCWSNFGSNVMNEKQVLLREGHAQLTDMPCPQDRNEFVQDKLKQNKLKQPVEVSQKQDINFGKFTQSGQIHPSDMQQHKSQEQNQHKSQEQHQHKSQEQHQHKSQEQHQHKSQEQNQHKPQEQHQHKSQGQHQHKSQEQNQHKPQEQHQLKSQEQHQHKSQEQHQLKSQEQHQLLLKLVQHAQQQQKQQQDQQQQDQQQQDQQQHCHKSQNLLNLAISGLAKRTIFSKNQGLIIHHHQPADVQLVATTDRSSLQTSVKSCPVEGEHCEGKSLKQGQMLEQTNQQHAQIDYTVQEKNAEIEKSQKNAEIEKSQKNQRYSQQPSQAAYPTASAIYHQQEAAVMHKESAWQAQSSSIPKIAERLLQQSLNEKMLSSGEQLICKTDQLPQLSAQSVSISRSDQMTSTPTAALGHHVVPSVNQQHPEIARMLNSPVSPRQPASPRQSLSPRRVASPIQLSSSSAQFISPRQVVTPQLWQPASQRQSVNCIPPVIIQPSNSYFQADQIQTASSQQSSNSWQPLNTMHSSTTTSSQLVLKDHAQLFPVSVQLPTDQRLDLNQHVIVPCERPKFSDRGQKNDVGKIPQTGTDEQLVAPNFSTILSNSDMHQLSSTQSISLNKSVQVFSPGQVIHHRPPERKNVQNNVLNARKSQSSLSAQLSPATVPSTMPTLTVPVPLIKSTATVWHTQSSHLKSPEISLQSPKPMIQPASVPRLDKHIQQLQHQPVIESLGQKSFLDMDHQDSLPIQTDTRNRCTVISPASFHHQNQGTEKHVLEMQLYPSSGQYALPESTLADTKLINSYVVSSAHDRNFQSIANLMEKESSLIQYLFANNSPPIQTNERTQTSMSQTSLRVSQMHLPFSSLGENPSQCEDSSRIFPNVVCSYPEMRKNEGGLKVLSEIASERYQLAVAGKDDMSDLQADQPGYQGTSQSSTAVSEASDNMSHAMLVSEAISVKTLAPSTFNKTQSKPAKAFKHTEVEGSHPGTYIKLRQKKAKGLSLTHSQTPHREVRQRKPKKPFEQEETPVKRSPKTLHKKNFNSQKQIFFTPTQNPFHKKGQSQKIAHVKLKEETEQEETKQKFTRQMRSAAEDKVANNKHTDLATENTEEMKRAESRRLSKRLLVKEKEDVGTQKSSDSTKSRRFSKHSARVNYKEDASESVDESISARSLKPSRRASISSVDDALSETPVRMTTRSKNRNTGNKTTVNIGNKIDTHKRKLQNFTGKKKLTSMTSRITQKATMPINKVSKMDTRNRLRSPGIESQSRSAVRSDNAAASSSRRLAACQALAKLDSSKSGMGANMKRPLPSELLEGLPPLTQKRLKQLQVSKIFPKSHKPFGKIQSLKEKASKESLKAEVSKITSKVEAGASPLKPRETKKQKYRKKKGKMKTRLPTPKEDWRRPVDVEDGATEIINSILKSQDIELGPNLEYAGTNLERTVTKSEMKKTSHNDKRSFAEETNETQNDLQQKVADLEYDKHVTEKLPEIVRKAELNSESKSIEQKSAIRSTTTVSSSAIQIKVSVQSSMSSSVSSATSPDDKSVSQAALNVERHNMVMYKLVPVLQDSMSDLDECLVPITGYYVPGGNNDCILIPHNFMHGSRINISSSSTRPWRSLSLSTGELLHTLPTLPTCSGEPCPTLLPDPTCSGEPCPTLSPDPTCSGEPCPTLSPEAVKTSSSTQPLTRACTPQSPGSSTNVATTLPSTVGSLSTHLCTVSSVAQPLAWAPHLPQTPPISVGSPSSVVFPKKSWTPTQTSLLQNRSSPSWNAAPSSPLISSSTWNSSPSAPLPPLSQQRHEQHQPWTAASKQVAQESAWSSPPSVTAAALESWSKEFFPGTVLANTLSQRVAEPVIQSQAQHASLSSQSGMQNLGYSMGTGSSQQPQMYSSSIDHVVSSSMLYNAGPSQDSEFADNRHDSGIQGFLRQVSSNPAGFSQELTGFNLGQQDMAYLENRLRQSLSPNTLFSAVAAYDDTSGHGTVVSHDNSLQESINLVHTVNLDMEEGNLDGSVNLDLADLGNISASAMNVSTSMDRSGANINHQEEMLEKVDNSGTGATDGNNSVQKDLTVAVIGEPRADSKKPVRERKSQYEIVMKNDVKRYRCLTCGKNFGVATIYRHLRIHDPDYKVRCSFCGKQYTQQHSLTMHCWKAHGVKANSAGLVKSPKYEDLSSLEQESLMPDDSLHPKLESLNLPLKSLGTQMDSVNVLIKDTDTQLHSPSEPLMSPSAPLSSAEVFMKSPGDSKHQQKTSLTSDPLFASHDRSELSKQQVAHKQVEELRRLKAEKKLAAAQRKAEGNATDDGGLTEDGLHQNTSKYQQHCTGEDTLAGNDLRRPSLTYTHTELSSLTRGQRGSEEETSYPVPTGTPATVVDNSSRTSDYLHEQYDNLVAIKSQGSASAQFQFNLSHQGLSTVPQFHADNIPKPIPTPIIKGSLSSKVESLKELVSSEDGLHVKSGSGEGKHVCEICNTQLNTKSGYILHMRRHNKIKTKFCSYCDKGFHTGQELRSHERTHTGEKPYKCEICHTSFAHSGSFVSHKKGHEKRGERDPFLVVDGSIQYPPTFKKPRLSTAIDGSGQMPRRVDKHKLEKSTSESSDSEHLMPAQNLGGQQTSVIRRSNHDNSLSEHLDSADEDFDKTMPSRWKNLTDPRLTADSLRSSMESSTLSDHSLNSSSLGLVVTAQNGMSQEQDSRGYTPSGESYSSLAGNVASDYYSNSAGYSQSVQQREFVSPHVDTPPSPHDFYSKQGKYYPRCSSVDPYPTGRQSQAYSLPVDLAKEKSQQYGGSHSYSDSGHGSGSYYSPQQQSSGYHYTMPSHTENAYHQDHYEDSQYKNDPSSTEIVKKLLQHYNVPASTFQEAVPLDFSHQMQDTPEYNRTGHDTLPSYSVGESGHSTPAPPPYNARITTPEKHFYSSQPSTSNYEPSMARQQQHPSRTQDQPVLGPHESQQRQLLQSRLMPEEQFESPRMQDPPQDLFTSKGKYSASQSYEATQYSSPPPVRRPSSLHSQSYDVAPSLSQEYYSQPLPKFESLAREPIGSPSERK